MQQILIDRLTVPADAKGAFIERMNINRGIISKQPGFMGDEIFEPVNMQGDLIYITMATWESDAALQTARQAVQAEYQREGFDLPAFCQRLNIKIERSIYHKLSN